MSYLLYFLAGLLMTIGVPHFVKGITGEMHSTPFRKDAGAMLNVVWGTALFFAAGWLWLFTSLLPHGLGLSLVAFFIGVLVAGIRLSKVFERNRTVQHRLSFN